MIYWVKIFESELALRNNVSEGKPYQAALRGERILIVNASDAFYAIQEKCPHNGASLAHGFCDKAEIVCPVHRYRFNVINGRATAGGSFALKTYPVKVQTDGVFIGFKAKWWEI
jgi:nitrite reductase/ring-hydroxylating ferredoxin subunit